MAETKSGPVITISRQFGSGGREVGKKLAEALGLTYYDKEDDDNGVSFLR